MKIILTESQIQFITEVLKDEIPSYMSDIIKKRYQSVPDILDRDIPKHTDKIPNVKVEITDENLNQKIKNDLVNHFSENIISQYELSNIAKLIKENNDFYRLLDESAEDVNLANISPRYIRHSSEDTIESIGYLYSKEFKLPTTQSTDIKKPIFGKNKSGIATLLKVSKKLFTELKDLDVESLINDKRLVGLREPIINYHTNLDKLLEQTKLYLYITDKPDDKLRMSISKYYDSCQNLYTGNEQGTQYNKKLLANVFDPNSKVAYLIYNVPFTDSRGNQHPFTSIARTIIRVNENGNTLFDRVYPSDIEEVFFKIIEEKTGLKNTGKPGDTYHYSKVKGLPQPYMDKYSIKTINKGDFELEDEPKVQALQYALSVNIDEIEEVSDDEFIVDGEKYNVDDYATAIEKTRDWLLDTFDDVHSETKLYDLIRFKVFSTDCISELYGLNDDTLEEMGYGTDADALMEYLNDSGITLFKDLTTIKNPEMWIRGNLNLDALIEYWGGEWECMNFVLARDGNLYEHNGYYVYKVDIG